MVQTDKIRLIRYLFCLSVQIKGEDSSSNKLFNWWSVSTVKYGLLN